MLYTVHLLSNATHILRIEILPLVDASLFED